MFASAAPYQPIPRSPPEARAFGVSAVGKSACRAVGWGVKGVWVGGGRIYMFVRVSFLIEGMILGLGVVVVEGRKGEVVWVHGVFK